MGMLDHWQPMLPGTHLARKPVGVRLAGRDIALYRTHSGAVGAFDDQCPHRRMRLSRGLVVGEKLRCCYHGWAFDRAGNGASPGTPKLHACVATWDVREEYGYIWVKSTTSNPVFPQLDIKGWYPMCQMDFLAPAPLELTLDSFCEIEHSSMVHDLFGYELERMSEVTVRFETTDDTVTVINRGPHKPIGFPMNHMVGVGKNYYFNDTWTTYFSPVYAVFDHFWTDPDTGAEALVKWRNIIFFTPVDAGTTRLTAFIYARSRWFVWPAGGLFYFRGLGLARRKVNLEIGRDVAILEGLSSYEPSLEGMKLSRFDKALSLNRERLQRIYRGKCASTA